MYVFIELMRMMLTFIVYGVVFCVGFLFVTYMYDRYFREAVIDINLTFKFWKEFHIPYCYYLDLDTLVISHIERSEYTSHEKKDRWYRLDLEPILCLKQLNAKGEIKMVEYTRDTKFQFSSTLEPLFILKNAIILEQMRSNVEVKKR